MQPFWSAFTQGDDQNKDMKNAELMFKENTQYFLPGSVWGIIQYQRWQQHRVHCNEQ